MLASAVRDGCRGRFVARRAEREMLKGCSREEVTVPAPVGASRSLRNAVGMPRITFVPTASNTCCEPGYSLQGLHDAER